MKKVQLAFVLTMPFFCLKAQQNLLPAAGNVGIHTTTPTQALEVGGAGLFTGNALNVDNRVGTYILNGRIVSLSGASGNNLSIEGQQLMFFTGTSYTEKMRLTAAGKLGLGPVDPIDKFHLYTGPTAAYGTSGGITISDSYIAARLWDSFGGHDVGTLDLFNDQNQKVRLIADGNSYINGGNLGIGTTTPSEKLSVNGNIKTQKLIVSQTNWPDYVFHSTYKLNSLSELEQFIKKNKHLPEMPSASEVEKKGISVGDNQALLLKKIEEMTLYIISQQKQIDKLTMLVKKVVK